MKVLQVNGEEYRSHSRETEGPEYAVWRQADDLIKAGKKQEAAELLRASIGENDPVPHSTLVFRVVIALEGLL